ncbi:MAG: membrane protein insertase YidC [Deltaproteobacteria bacterium]|nr:membrane protein insertase YidC [Deltaproteobacteria bacterium]MDZ4224826.1 membrane protein insertase YidC [bacterium]
MKNEYRGLAAAGLSVGVLILWYTVIAPPPKPQTPAAPPATQQIQDGEAGSVPSLPAATAPAVGISSRKEGETVLLSNDLVTIGIDSLGGVAKSWELKKFSGNGETPKPVTLAEVQGGILDMELRGANFEAPSPIPFRVANRSQNSVHLVYNGKNISVHKKIVLDPNTYQLRMEMELQNRSKSTVTFVPVLNWGKIPYEESPQRGILFFKSPPDKWHPIYSKDGSLKAVPYEEVPQTETVSGKIGWIGAQSRYFIGAIVPVGREAAAVETGQYGTAGQGDFFFTKLVFSAVQVLPGDQWIQKFNVYGGPKELKNLQAIGSNFEKAIGYGWITVVAVPILFLLQFFYKIVHNYGVAIILLTIFVKLLLNPINKKSLKSMKAMQELQPKIKELRAKYGKDQQRLNMETMQLFKAHKVNPMGGCLPMLLQFPIYIALYQVLWNSVELYHAPFFWFYKDLSSPDPYFIVPALLGVAMFFQTKMMPNPSADPTQQKIMMLMPLMFCGLMVFLPIGLGLYILVNTIMTILQQWMYNKGIRMRDIVTLRVLNKA